MDLQEFGFGNCEGGQYAPYALLGENFQRKTTTGMGFTEGEHHARLQPQGEQYFELFPKESIPSPRRASCSPSIKYIYINNL